MGKKSNKFKKKSRKRIDGLQQSKLPWKSTDHPPDRTDKDQKTQAKVIQHDPEKERLQKSLQDRREWNDDLNKLEIPTKARVPRATDAQKAHWQEEATISLKKGKRTECLGRMFSQVLTPNKSTIWEQSIGLGFAFCAALEMDPFGLCSCTAQPLVLAPIETIMENNWNIPSLRGPMYQCYETQLFTAYQILQQHHQKENRLLVNELKIPNKLMKWDCQIMLQEDIDLIKQRQCWKLVRPLAFPDLKQLDAAVKFFRQTVYKVLHSLLHSEKYDRRPSALKCLIQLSQIDNKAQFKRHLDEFVSKGIMAKKRYYLGEDKDTPETEGTNADSNESVNAEEEDNENEEPENGEEAENGSTSDRNGDITISKNGNRIEKTWSALRTKKKRKLPLARPTGFKKKPVNSKRKTNPQNNNKVTAPAKRKAATSNNTTSNNTGKKLPPKTSLEKTSPVVPSPAIDGKEENSAMKPSETALPIAINGKDPLNVKAKASITNKHASFIAHTSFNRRYLIAMKNERMEAKRETFGVVSVKKMRLQRLATLAKMKKEAGDAFASSASIALKFSSSTFKASTYRGIVSNAPAQRIYKVIALHHKGKRWVNLKAAIDSYFPDPADTGWMRPKPDIQDELFSSLISYMGDEGLAYLLEAYQNEHHAAVLCGNMVAALKGILTPSLPHLFASYLPDDEEHDYTPPSKKEVEGFNIAFENPGHSFRDMANKLFNTVEVFLNTTDNFGKAPSRWNWQYTLLKGCNLLDSDDYNEKCKANLFCLILSAATPDNKCIEATIELCKNRLFDLKKLAETPIPVIAKHIQKCGIQIKRAKFLQDAARLLLEPSQREGPKTRTVMKNEFLAKITGDKMERLLGVGPKTRTVMRNEVLGQITGVASDIHIQYGVLAYNLGKWNKPSECNAVCAEASIRTWLPTRKHPVANKVFGSFAQLFTQNLKTINTPEAKSLCGTVVYCMKYHIHMPMHISLLWWAITRVRSFYRKNEINKNYMKRSGFIMEEPKVQEQPAQPAKVEESNAEEAAPSEPPYFKEVEADSDDLHLLNLHMRDPWEADSDDLSFLRDI